MHQGERDREKKTVGRGGRDGVREREREAGGGRDSQTDRQETERETDSIRAE